MNVKCFVKVKSIHQTNDFHFDDHHFDGTFYNDQKLFDSVDINSPFLFLLYGETNSGKTFSLSRFLHLFLQDLHHYQLSCVEVYNNDFYDLLAKRAKLSFYNKRLVLSIRNYSHFQSVYKSILSHRSSFNNGHNKCSSRSHMILSIISHKGNFHFCDLAGFEKNVNVQSHFINLSLYCLRDCIRALHDHSNVPFRRSKLTHCLQSHLHNPIYCICTIIPLASHTKQTQQSLQYGLSMKHIQFPSKSISNFELEKFLVYSKKLFLLQTEIVSNYLHSRDVVYLNLMKNSFTQYRGTLTYMLSLL